MVTTIDNTSTADNKTSGGVSDTDISLIQKLTDEGIKQPQKAIDICDAMTTGLSMRQSCEKVGVKHNTFLKWAVRSQTLGDQYARARLMLFDVKADRLLEYPDIEQFLGPDGRVDNGLVTLFKAQKDNEKWVMSRLDHKRFGDKVGLLGDEDNPITIQKIERVIVDKATAKIEAIEAEEITD